MNFRNGVVVLLLGLTAFIVSAQEISRLIKMDTPTLQKLAESGNGDAAYFLAMRYRTGRADDVPPDNLKAVHWYRKAAEAGHVDAQNYLGMLYLSGKMVEKNDALGFHWLFRAAEQGKFSAQRLLASLYITGDGAPRSRVDAYQWLSIAAAQASGKVRDDIVADMTRLEAHMTPEQVTEAQRRAAAFFPTQENPAVGNDGGAVNLFGEVGSGVPSEPENPTDRDFCAFRRASLAALHDAAERGHAVAQYVYAIQYGGTKQWTSSAKWAKRAAEAGLAEAQCYLAMLYYHGRGVSGNDSESFFWAQRAAEQGLPDAQTLLGLLHQAGRGAEPSEALAVVWLHRAAEAGQPRAQSQYAAILYHRATTRGDFNELAEAYAWFVVARDNPHAAASMGSRSREWRELIDKAVAGFDETMPPTYLTQGRRRVATLKQQTYVPLAPCRPVPPMF